MRWVLGSEMLIAEIGQNFCGDMELAITMIELAKESDADLVKFQLYDGIGLYKEELRNKETREEALRCLDCELSHQDAITLFKYGKEIGVEVFFSVFDTLRVQWCEQMGVKRYKVACTHKPNALLEAIEHTGKECIMSFPDNYSIGIDCKAPQWAYYGFRQHFASGLWRALLCPPGYPQEVDLEDFGLNSKFSGISDHTIGLDFAQIALARGTEIIEEHFCIDHETGVDAEWSSTPEELKELRRFSESL